MVDDDTHPTRVPPLPRLHLALASPGFALARWCQTALLGILGGALAVTGWGWVAQQALEQEAARYAQSLARVEGLNQQFTAQLAAEGLTLTKDDIAAVSQQVTFANHLAAKRAQSWTRLLSDLEAAVPPRVSLTSVQLNARDGTVKLQGQTLTLRDLEALTRGLEAHPAFARVTVAHHRVETPKATGRAAPGRAVVHFGLTVAYHAPGEEAA